MLEDVVNMDVREIENEDANLIELTPLWTSIMMVMNCGFRGITAVTCCCINSLYNGLGQSVRRLPCNLDEYSLLPSIVFGSP
jgi:hypothetical protein